MAGKFARLARRRLKAVTILEVLIVLAIIALLASVVAPRVIGYLGRAKATTAQTQINNLDAAIGFFAIDVGRVPTDAEGLAALFTAPASPGNWAGPYLGSESSLIDPWGRDYIYAVTGDGTYEIRSLGRDGREGGTGLDADLTSQ
ncbi:MAG: type II secretion system major pseudopilin GspG [Pseudomonadota bacterium]